MTSWLNRRGTITTKQRTKTMTISHPQQSDHAQCAAKMPAQMGFNSTVRISSPICTVIFTEREKSCAIIFKRRCKSTSMNYHFTHCTPYPLSEQGFYGSLKSRHWTREVSRDSHAMTAKCPARHLAEFLAVNPSNGNGNAAECPSRRLARSLNHDIQKL